MQDPLTPNHVPFIIPIPQVLQHAHELQQNKIGIAITINTTITANHDIAPSIPSNLFKVKWLIEKLDIIFNVSMCFSCFSVLSIFNEFYACNISRPHTNCTNKIGSYICTCLPGYTDLVHHGGCVDQNECSISGGLKFN